MRFLQRLAQDNRGLTLIEVMITAVMLGTVLGVVSAVFYSSNDTYAKTSRRVSLQRNARLGMDIMVKELRQAGCDPAGTGVSAIVFASSDSLRIQADLDGDGVIETAEPSEDVTYFYNVFSQVLFRNPGTGPQVLVPNVSSLVLDYLDANNQPLGPLPLTPEVAAQVRSIAISITTRDREGETITLTTTAALRNT
jgi:prepilin-type N-terminal cleavage/methylation domain-containing protein